jgi:hypothetical protein
MDRRTLERRRATACKQLCPVGARCDGGVCYCRLGGVDHLPVRMEKISGRYGAQCGVHLRSLFAKRSLRAAPCNFDGKPARNFNGRPFQLRATECSARSAQSAAQTPAPPVRASGQGMPLSRPIPTSSSASRTGAPSLSAPTTMPPAPDASIGSRRDPAVAEEVLETPRRTSPAAVLKIVGKSFNCCGFNNFPAFCIDLGVRATRYSHSTSGLGARVNHPGFDSFPPNRIYRKFHRSYMPE